MSPKKNKETKSSENEKNFRYASKTFSFVYISSKLTTCDILNQIKILIKDKAGKREIIYIVVSKGDNIKPFSESGEFFYYLNVFLLVNKRIESASSKRFDLYGNDNNCSPLIKKNVTDKDKAEAIREVKKYKDYITFGKEPKFAKVIRRKNSGTNEKNKILSNEVLILASEPLALLAKRPLEKPSGFSRGKKSKEVEKPIKELLIPSIAHNLTTFVSTKDLFHALNEWFQISKSIRNLFSDQTQFFFESLATNNNFNTSDFKYNLKREIKIKTVDSKIKKRDGFTFSGPYGLVPFDKRLKSLLPSEKFPVGLWTWGPDLPSLRNYPDALIGMKRLVFKIRAFISKFSSFSQIPEMLKSLSEEERNAIKWTYSVSYPVGTILTEKQLECCLLELVKSYVESNFVPLAEKNLLNETIILIENNKEFKRDLLLIRNKEKLKENFKDMETFIGDKDNLEKVIEGIFNDKMSVIGFLREEEDFRKQVSSIGFKDIFQEVTLLLEGKEDFKDIFKQIEPHLLNNGAFKETFKEAILFFENRKVFKEPNVPLKDPLNELIEKTEYLTNVSQVGGWLIFTQNLNVKTLNLEVSKKALTLVVGADIYIERGFKNVLTRAENSPFLINDALSLTSAKFFNLFPDGYQIWNLLFCGVIELCPVEFYPGQFITWTKRSVKYPNGSWTIAPYSTDKNFKEKLVLYPCAILGFRMLSFFLVKKTSETFQELKCWAFSEEWGNSGVHALRYIFFNCREGNIELSEEELFKMLRDNYEYVTLFVIRANAGFLNLENEIQPNFDKIISSGKKTRIE